MHSIAKWLHQNQFQHCLISVPKDTLFICYLQSFQFKSSKKCKTLQGLKKLVLVSTLKITFITQLSVEIMLLLINIYWLTLCVWVLNVLHGIMLFILSSIFQNNLDVCLNDFYFTWITANIISSLSNFICGCWLHYLLENIQKWKIPGNKMWPFKYLVPLSKLY